MPEGARIFRSQSVDACRTVYRTSALEWKTYLSAVGFVSGINKIAANSDRQPATMTQ